MFPDVSGSTDTKEQAMKTFYGRFVSDQSVAIGMRYVLIAALVSVAIFTTLESVGSNLINTTFELALNSQADR
jgi:Flp pilus assembly pilin Flp